MFKSMDDRMKTTEKYFPVVLFIMLYNVDEILKCDHLYKNSLNRRHR